MIASTSSARILLDQFDAVDDLVRDLLGAPAEERDARLAELTDPALAALVAQVLVAETRDPFGGALERGLPRRPRQRPPAPLR